MANRAGPPWSLEGARVRVSPVVPADAPALRDFHRRNRRHLRHWMPPTAADFETTDYWRRWTAAAPVLLAEDRAVRTVLRMRADPEGPIIGQVNIGNIVRGALQAAHLGYHLDGDFEGRGLMSESLRLVVDHAFGPLGLHRLMANHVVGNRRSAKVLARLGFRVEGLAKAYLFIDGAWRDHVLTALTDPAGRPPPPP